MMEDKREKIRTATEAVMQAENWDKRMAAARERARLTVLNLTEKDKRLLRAMKIEAD